MASRVYSGNKNEMQRQASVLEANIDYNTKLYHIALTVSGVAFATLLSATGILPSSILTTVMIGGAKAGMELISSIVETACEENAKKKNDPSPTKIEKMEVWQSCICSPIIEEVLYRGLLQSGLHHLFSRALPAVSLAAIGLPVSLTTLVTIGVTTAILAKIAHSISPRKEAKSQAIHAAIGAIVFGSLYQYYGIWASSLAHIVNNTALLGAAFSGRKVQQIWNS